MDKAERDKIRRDAKRTVAAVAAVHVTPPQLFALLDAADDRDRLADENARLRERLAMARSFQINDYTRIHWNRERDCEGFIVEQTAWEPPRLPRLRFLGADGEWSEWSVMGGGLHFFPTFDAAFDALASARKETP